MGEGKKLQELLKKRNCTVTKLAADTGISVNTLYALIKRDSGISNSNLNKIAEALNMSVDELSNLLSEEDTSNALSEEKPYVFDVNTLDQDIQKILVKLNELSIQYREKLQSADELRRKIAFLTKQQESIAAEKEGAKTQLKVVENDILNIAIDLDWIRQKLK